MIWPSRRDEQRLPADEVWAARGRAGPVPEGWVGLRALADGHCAAWAEAGKAVPQPRWGAEEGVVWWVRVGAWPLRFAPWPDVAPEAGIACALRLDGPRDADHRDLLASCLAGEAADVLAGHWARLLRQQRAVSSLPPCATSRQLAGRAAELSAALRFTWQVRVTELQRCDLEDLMPFVEEAALALPKPTTVPAEDRVAPAPGEHGVDDGRALAQDRLACQHLGRGLPRLALDLQQRWAAGGWSGDLAIAARQRAVSQRLGLMASKLGAWPSLGPRADARREMTSTGRSMVALQAVRAVEALVAAEAALQALPPARTPPAADALCALEQAVEVLESRVQARMLPWWE